MPNTFAAKIVWLILNYNCNNRCTWCYAQQQLETRVKQMPLTLAKNSIDLLKKLSVEKIILLGGEPTLYPYLEDIITYAKSNNIKVGIVTNGRMLANKEFVRRLIKAGIDNIVFSIEGSTSEIHDKITRVKGSFGETLKGIKNALEEGVEVATETTMCIENLDNLQNTLDMLYTIGVKSPGFNICTDPIDVKTKSMIDIKTYAVMREDMYKYAKSKGKQIRFIIPLPICSYRNEVMKNMLNEGVVHGSCQIYSGSAFVIDYNGDVLPCVRFSGYSVGNIIKNKSMLQVMNETEFRHFWESGEPKTFRNKIWRFPSKKCIADKKYWGTCVGGCPLLWLTFDPRKEIPGIADETELLESCITPTTTAPSENFC